MTFEEWWTKAVFEWEIPMHVSFYPFVKMVAVTAWNRGQAEGSMETARFMTAARKEEEVDTKP